ncbi:hypothetical protein DV736_g532, partial [Chaetothyriales sp. CBS 134916]
MRPLRLVLLVTFFVALPVFLTTWSLFAHSDPAAKLRAGYAPHTGRLSALLSFSAPSTLFPPSAIISLTNDNSTFFLARPAAFGPALPAKGLSGQLWVGRGFGDEPALAGGALHTTGWEFGCSDVPDWQESERQQRAGLPVPATAAAKSQKRALDSAADTKAGKSSHSQAADSAVDPSVDDGTDDYLHSPLPDSNPAAPAKPGEPANAQPDKRQKPTHADIESLQESADIAGKIVLLARGGCGFHEKVKWVQRRGGIAVIVGEREKGGPLTSMYAKGDTSNVTIPAIFTTYNAAHLLASLAPDKTSRPDDNARLDNEPRNHRAAAAVAADKPVFTSAATLQRSPNVQAKSPAPSAHNEADWMQDALSAIGLADSSPWHAEDSRRPPGSGNIKWILQEDWDEDDAAKTKSLSATKSAARSVSSSVLPKATSTSARRSEDDFVIGVQDWRDTELIASKPTTTSSPHPNDPKSVPASLLDSGLKKPAETGLKGESITPGSGEYERDQDGSLKPDAKGSMTHPAYAKQDRSHKAGARRGWFSFLLGEKPCQQSKPPSQPHTLSGDPPAKKASDGPDEQDALWVTLTPTSLSTSPLFDTLLVLVISPLITLTVVYALLLLRSRIRRRRWRAPKSVVERLPVRTYHTMSATSSTTSSQPSSADHSQATSPTLQAVNNRSRPRSQTTTALLGCSPDSVLSLASTPPTEKACSKPRRKHFHGRQVECVVCLEEYVDGESQVMSLPCGHEFHADCITPWLVNRRRTCPICKRDVVRSMNRSGPPPHNTDQRLDRDHTTDHVQVHGALTSDDDPSSVLPIPSRDDETDDDDIERGEDVTIPLLGGQSPDQQQSPWRNAVTRTFNRLGRDHTQRQTPHGIDRSR